MFDWHKCSAVAGVIRWSNAMSWCDKVAEAV